MNLLISRSTVLVAAAIASLLAATPVRAQSDERAIVTVVTKFLDGLRMRDTARMRSTVLSGATFVSVGGPTGLEAPSAIDGIIERTGKGTGPGIDERLETPKVQTDEQLASLWAYRTLTLPGHTTIDYCGHDVYLLRKGPDGWKIFQIAGTSRAEGCRAIGN